LVVIAHLKSSKDKGKGKTPSNFVHGLEDDIVPDPEVGLGYDEPVAPEDESDDGDSDFEALDFEDEDDSDISLPGVRKMPHKRTSRVDTRRVDNPEAVEQMMIAAATDASIRDFMSGGASTSAGSSGHNISGHTGSTAPTEFYYAGSDVVPDSEPEGDLLEPIVQTGWMTPAKGKGRNKGQWKAEYDADDIHQDPYSARKEARRRSRVEKQDIRMLEYQLGRRLTHVGLADISCSLIYSFYFSYFDSDTGRKIYNSVAQASP
jgi:hypothetical protein